MAAGRSSALRTLLRASLHADSLLTLHELGMALPGRPEETVEKLARSALPTRVVNGEAMYRYGDVLDHLTGRADAAASVPGRDAGGLLSPAELAYALGVPVARVHRWTSDRSIPFFKLGHKTVRYRLSDVLSSAEQTTAAPEEHPHGRQQARRHVARRVQVQGPGDGPAAAIPPYDWSQHDKARG